METLRPYEDYKIARKKAESFIEHILVSTSYFEHCMGLKPTVFMSNDVLAIIAKGTGDALTSYKYKKPMTICGYDLEVVLGENKLYLGYQLSEPRW